MDNSKKKEIEQSLDENGSDYPYDINDMIYDEYGLEYIDSATDWVEYFKLLNEAKEENKVIKSVILDVDRSICCIAIILDRIDENNVLDVMIKINEKVNSDTTTFVRIITGKTYSDEYDEYFVKDYGQINSISNHNEKHTERLCTALATELENKGLLKYILALNI